MKIKVNKIYKEAHSTNARYRVLYGGAGSGKSHYVAQETLLNMLSKDDRYNYLVVRKTGKSIRNSVFRLVCDLISECNLSPMFTINKTEMSISSCTGSSLITSGLDDVEKLKSVANINRIWVEEASEITEKDFNQLDLRLRGQSKLGYQLTLTFNPISELHWLKRSFFDLGRPDSFVLKTTYLDNEFLDDSYINTLKELEKQDYQYYRIYALGEWGSLGNLVYSNWEKQEFDHSAFDNYFNGLDFGFADDPTAFIRCHYDKKRKTIYIVDEFYKQAMFIDEIADDLKNIIGSEMVTCDSSEPRSIADLKRNNIRAMPAKKGPGSIEHGIKWIQSHKIIVHPRCINAIKELTSYKWREDKDGNVIPKPVDMNNHCLTGDTIVNTVTHGDIKIADLVGETGYANCFDEVNNKRTIGEFHDVRMTRENADVYEITTYDGRVIRATDDHPVLTESGWKLLKNLNIGDNILDIYNHN